MKSLFKLSAALLLAAVSAFSQLPLESAGSRAGGVFVAYNYGLWFDKIATGTSATGAATIALTVGTVALPDGRAIVPFAVTAPLLIGAGATAETVTPTAVSGCVKNSPLYASCLVTATFTYVHGAGELVQSGTFGLQEAINDAAFTGGGVIAVDSAWFGAGGTQAIITAATPGINTGLEVDNTGNGNLVSSLLNGSCSGTATASSTLGLYGLGESTVLTCTSTTVALGQVMAKPGVLRALSVTAGTAGVNASSGVFTVLKNGAATTLTCTVGIGTACTDNTHTATFVAGDVISIQFTTQATETLAAVKASVQAF